MLGDAPALEALLPLALQVDSSTVEGRSARRMVVRAYRQQAQRLEQQAQLSVEPQASLLRSEAARQFCRAVLARHIDLNAVAVLDRPPPVPAAAVAEPEPACLLDPPPDAPIEPLALNNPPLLLGAGGVILNWGAPDDHGKPISKYDVTIEPRPLLATVSISGTQARIGGLPAGSYTFTVKATNADGTGPVSAPSNPVTIGKAPPDPATNVKAQLSSGLVVVNWTAPAKGAPLTQYWLQAYDAATAKPVGTRRSVSGDSSSALYTDLPKGNYVFGVRAFNAGGYAGEVRSAALAYTPPATPFTPSLAGFPSASVLDFDLGKSGLDVEALRRRMAGANEQANKWRFDYLKSLAVKAANDSLRYEGQILTLMQMALSKVGMAQALLSPVLQEAVKDIQGAVRDINKLASSEAVQGVVKQVGEAAATALSLEGLLKFLLDNSPLDFWLNLFKGLILDIASFDTDLGYTNAFLHEYFDGDIKKALIAMVDELRKRVDVIIDQIAIPLRNAVSGIVSGTNEELGRVLKAFGDPPLLMAVSSTGETIPGGDPFAPLNNLLDKLGAAVDELIRGIKQAINDTLNNLLSGEGLLIKLVKAFIVYPILGILAVSFALGAIGAGIVAAIVAAAGVELIRLVARWITGPLLDSINDARKTALEALKQLQKVFTAELAVLDSPVEELALIAGHLAEVRELLPQAFLTDVASLLGEARRGVLKNANQLALAAERALGLEHCTAFDLINPDYQRSAAPAPQLPGGLDDGFMAGAAMLRDFTSLETARTQILEGKELTITQRLSLHKLLGGVGDPAAATGTIARTLKEFLSGGKLLLRLSEESIIDSSFPGLYRVLISDIRPVGVFGAAANSLAALPLTLPLTMTHLGPARTRIRRDANPATPPVMLDRVLQLKPDDLVKQLFVTAPEPKPGETRLTTVKEIVDKAVAAALAGLQIFNVGPLPWAIYRYSHRTAGWYYSPTDKAPPRPKDSGEDWVRDGIAFYGYQSVDKDLVALIRVRRKNPPYDYFMSTDPAELAKDGPADKDGFDITDKHIVSYVQPSGGAFSVPLFRFNGTDDVRHFYSRDVQEGNGMKDEGVQCGVRAVASPLRPLPAALANTAQIKAYLLKLLPDALSTFLSKQGGGLLDAATVSKAVSRIIEASFVKGLQESREGMPANAQTIAQQVAALKILDAIQFGFPVGTDVAAVKNLPGLERLLRDAHGKALRDQAARIAKWGETQFKDDRDPQIRALGYVTLEQTFKPETAVFNLLPSAGPLTALGRFSEAGPAPDGQQPVTAAATQQYRAFENRPFDGDLLLGLELPPPVNTLVDLLFEVTVRACYDENLASAVKASRSQRSGVKDRAGALLAGSSNQFFNLPGALPSLGFGASSVRTFNLSLRAHRDNLTQMSNAYVQSLLSGAETPASKDGLDIGGLRYAAAQHLPLAAGQPLAPLVLSGQGGMADQAIDRITLRFQHEKPSTLGSMAQLIALTPEDFGLPLKLSDGSLNQSLQDLLGSDAGEIVGLGIVMVPTRKGAARLPPAAGAKPGDLPVPAMMEKVSVQCDPVLQRLLPQLDAKGADALKVTDTLLMTSKPAGRVGWKELWEKAHKALPDLPLALPKSGDADAPPFLSLNLGDALKNELIHDVIFSVSVRVPARVLNLAASVI